MKAKKVTEEFDVTRIVGLWRWVSMQIYKGK